MGVVGGEGRRQGSGQPQVWWLCLRSTGLVLISLWVRRGVEEATVPEALQSRGELRAAFRGQPRSVSESKQETKDTNSLNISNLKFVWLEKWFAQLWHSSQNPCGPANWPVAGSPAPACICTTKSPLEKGKRKRAERWNVSCKLLSSPFVLHKYLSSSLDFLGT